MKKVASLLVAIAIIGVLTPQSGNAQRPGENCNRQSVADLVKTFVRAYNNGDTDKLESLWAADPDFEWYSVSNERERDDPYDRQTLIPYFEERHELGDRLRLNTLRVRAGDDRGMFGISYRLHRQSDQRAGRGRYHGKASAKEIITLPSFDNLSLSRCVLFVWSMGKE